MTSETQDTKNDARSTHGSNALGAQHDLDGVWTTQNVSSPGSLMDSTVCAMLATKDCPDSRTAYGRYHAHCHPTRRVHPAGTHVGQVDMPQKTLTTIPVQVPADGTPSSHHRDVNSDEVDQGSSLPCGRDSQTNLSSSQTILLCSFPPNTYPPTTIPPGVASRSKQPPPQ